MSFMSAVRKASPWALSNYLSNMAEAILDLAFDDIGSLFIAAIGYLVLCVLWVILLGIASGISDVYSRGL